MTDWRTLLTDLSEEVIKSESFDESMLRFYGIPELTEGDREQKWLGFPPAEESEISEVESRLDLSLPKSLREFYLFSNGWRQISDFVFEIVPIQNLNWIREVDPEFCEAVKGSFDIPELDSDREENEVAVLRSLCLAQKGDATTLLIDPENKTQGGEWVVGAWASWHPGMEWSGVGFDEFLRQNLADCRALNTEVDKG